MVDDVPGANISLLSELLAPGVVRCETACWEILYHRVVSKRQARVLCELYFALDTLQDEAKMASGWAPWQDRPIPPRVRQARKKYEARLLKAIRAGFLHHPYIAEWVKNHRAVGRRALLKRAKCGLDKGVALMKMHDVQLECEITTRRECGQSWRAIHRTLQAEQRVTHSWPAFLKWVNHHQCDAFFPYAPPRLRPCAPRRHRPITIQTA